MYEYLLPGIFIGLSAGFAPGPLMALVISQTLQHGRKEGIKVAVAPFITDLPIIALITIVLSFLTNLNFFLGLISFLGAGYLSYLAYESMKITGITVSSKKVKPQSIKKGIIANLLNPSPYFFYFTVGGPLILKSLNSNPLYGAIFIFSFLFCLVLSKIVLAYIAEHSRSFLKSSVYVYINRFLAVLLVFYAIKFIHEGIQYLSH